MSIDRTAARPPGPSGPSAAPEGPVEGRPPARRRRRLIVLLAVLLVLTVPGVSFGRAMLYPGSAPASVRAVEWLREHGAGGIVNAVENWVYSQHAPPTTGAPADRTPSGAATAAPSTRAAVVGTRPPRVRLLTHLPKAKGEGVWQVNGTTRRGKPTLFTTWFRPDARHTPVVAGVALIPQSADRLHLAGGTREPVPGMTWPEGGKVPRQDRSRLVAAFNAGFKTKDARGGWFAAGRTAVRLVKGAASVVITKDGRARVGSWGTDVWMTPQVVAVRQNLALTIRGGRPVAGVDGNAHGQWGSDHNQYQYTWRSGIGTDAAGDLVYVAGRGMTLATLTQAMVRAGVVTGMELDIHPAMVTFNTFDHGPAGLTGHRLLSAMTRPADRYLAPDQRDFFYVTSR